MASRPIPSDSDVSLDKHSCTTDEDLGRRLVRAMRLAGDSKSEAIRAGIEMYIDRHEGDTVESIEDQIDDLVAEKERKKQEVRKLEDDIESIDSKVDALNERLDEMQSMGDHDELLDDLVTAVEAGADLNVIHQSTEKLDRLRRLGSYDSVADVMDAIEAAANGGDPDGR